MKKIRIVSIVMIAFVLTMAELHAQDFIQNLLKDELNLHFNSLQKQEKPPYFMSYRLRESQLTMFGTAFGSLVMEQKSRDRLMSVEVRVGDYKFDNTHPINEMGFGNNFSGISIQMLPLEDSLLPLRKAIRQCTDEGYKSSLEAFEELRLMKDSLNDGYNDFSNQEASVFSIPCEPFVAVDSSWIDYLKEITASFNDDENILEARAILAISSTRDYHLNTEGTSLALNGNKSSLNIVILFSCEDGNMAPYVKSYNVNTPDQLPGKEQMLKEVAAMKLLIAKLRTAPLADPYSGPALLSAGASGVFFHEIFGHRVEGHRLSLKMDAHTFKKQLGEKILPESMSITFDPSAIYHNETPLIGHYMFDDEGVAGQRVEVVKNGIFMNYLMSRKPVKGIANSNGHGRGEFGVPAVSRQSNLFVTSTSGVSDEKLYESLRKLCKKQKKEYGFLFEEVIGGFTNTDRMSPNSFNVIPVVVYKVFADGRPNELVRGVTLIGTPLTMFSEIEECGKNYGVFNGYCGAESGSVPTSTIAPSLLVKKIETQKQMEIRGGVSRISSPDLDNQTITGEQ